MATVTITINTDNDAFGDDNEGNEVARLLREQAEQMDMRINLSPHDDRRLRDVNGNTVGTVEVTS